MRHRERIKGLVIVVALYALVLALAGCASTGSGSADDARRARQFDAIRVEQTYVDGIVALSDLRDAGRIDDRQWDAVLRAIHVIGPQIDDLKAKAASGQTLGWDAAMATIRQGLVQFAVWESEAKKKPPPSKPTTRSTGSGQATTRGGI